jgi:hypothetical protein
MTYTWIIQELKALAYDEQSGLENVIRSVKWHYKGEAGDHTHTLSGNLNLEAPSDEQFVPWDILKSDPNIVISWLENGLDVQSLQDNIARVIEIKAKPREITLHLDAE